MPTLPSEAELALSRPSNGPLAGKTVAFVATDGFEEVELSGPRDRLERAGARTVVLSTKSGHIQGYDHHEKGNEVPVDMHVELADARTFDALVLPGGVMSPDALRTEEPVLRFVQGFAAAKKPIAAICHGPWTLVNAELVKGHTLTSWPSLRKDLENAGATWVDEEVVVDGALITSRKPDDVPAFSDKIIEALTR
jgi:protease I